MPPLTRAAEPKAGAAVRRSTSGFRLPRALHVFLIVSSAGWVLSLGSALFAMLHHHRSFKDAMSGLMLMGPLFDLLCYRNEIHALPPTFSPGRMLWAYPAPCLFFYRFLYLFSSQDGSPSPIVWLYDICVALALIVAMARLGGAMQRRGLSRGRSWAFLLAALGLSWPIAFSLQRGNIESFLWLGVAAGVAAYAGRRYTLAAILFGVVAACKPFPIVFFALLLRERRFRAVGIGVAALAATTLAGLAFFGHSQGYSMLQAYRTTTAGMNFFLQDTSGRYTALNIGYDHSLFGLIKWFLRNNNQRLSTAFALYKPASALFGLVMLLPMWRLPRLNRVFLLTTLSVLLPATSFDYTLQSLYVPWGWLVLESLVAARQSRPLTHASLWFGVLALLTMPEVFVHWDRVMIASQFKAVILLVLLTMACLLPLPDTTPDMAEPALAPSA